MEQALVETVQSIELDSHTEAAQQELSLSELALVGGGSGIMLFI